MNNSPHVSDPSAWRQDDSLAPKFGCRGCPDFGRRCGGLRISGPAFDCTTFCDCVSPQSCDRACRNNPYFFKRFKEVQSFDLREAPGPFVVSTPFLDGYAPLIYHGSKRTAACKVSAVAIPFFILFDRRTGKPRFNSRRELTQALKIPIGATIVASSTAKDRPLERWWDLGESEKRLVYENLRKLGIALVSTPNYSVFNNVPFWDNWHNQKRGVLSWAEFLRHDIPAALHINAHTAEDYLEFLKLIRARTDIAVLSVEFGTGEGHTSRISWHTQQLCEIAAKAKRPLGLIVRGGISVVRELRQAYAPVLYIDTEPFIKTQKRQRAQLGNDFRVRWHPQMTAPNEALDHRLQESLDACAKNIKCISTGEIGEGAPRISVRPANDRGDKSRDSGDPKQLSFLLPQHSSIDTQDVVAASKTDQSF